MTIAILSADVGFIGFNNAHQSREVIILKHRPYAMADIEGSLVCGRPAILHQHPLDLQGRDAFLGLGNQIDDFEPDRQGIVGVLEHRTDQSGEAIAVFLVADQDFARCLVTVSLPLLHTQVQLRRGMRNTFGLPQRTHRTPSGQRRLTSNSMHWSWVLYCS